MDEPARAADWWTTLYDDVLAELVLVRRDPEELRATVAFLGDVLGLRPGAVVFDQCCGIGSLSMPLAEAGAHVLGVDQCAAYVERARREAGARGLPCTFHTADAFEFVPAQPCDAALNWATSFGYAADDRRNRDMLRRACAALRAGGRFVLDYHNIPFVLRHFREHMVRRHATPAGEILLLRESVLRLDRGTLEQDWTFVLPDGRRRVGHGAVRLYLPHALADMLREAGFTDVEFRGGVRGEPLGPDSPRCICLARKL
jgi:SAM-dependent methyltransferase